MIRRSSNQIISQCSFGGYQSFSLFRLLKKREKAKAAQVIAQKKGE